MAPKLKSSKEIVKTCKDSLDELKAINICSFEVEKISSFTSFILGSFWNFWQTYSVYCR